jgi:hypothetical protein
LCIAAVEKPPYIPIRPENRHSDMLLQRKYRILTVDISWLEGLPMMLPMPLCLFNRHKPNRARAKWDGVDFVGTCRHCGTHIRRKEHKHWIADRPNV